MNVAPEIQIFKILSLAFPTACFFAAGYVMLSDSFFRVWHVLGKRIIPKMGYKALRAAYSSTVVIIWAAVHAFQMNVCLTTNQDICNMDVFQNRWCVVGSVFGLMALLLAAWCERAAEIFLGLQTQSTRLERIMTVGCPVVAWAAMADRDATALLLILLCSSTRLRLVGGKTGKICRVYIAFWKVTVVGFGLLAMLDSCPNASKRLAVGATLAAIVA